MWWEAKAGAYHGVWCDNMSPSGCDASTVAKWQGDNLVLTSTSEMAGKKYNNRNTYSDFKPGSFTITFESASGSNPMKKVMTINYKKAAAAKAAAQ